MEIDVKIHIYCFIRCDYETELRAKEVEEDLRRL